MTILDTTNRRFYTGNGTATTYAINSLSGDALTGITIFKITDIKVYLGGVLQTYTTDYTITSDTPPSAFAGKLVNASVVFVTAPLASVEIAIVREVPYTQELGLSNGNNVAPKPLESQLDKLAVQTQQLSEVLTDRVLRVEAFESSLLDPITVENGSYLKWDAGQLINATPIDVGVDISDATVTQVSTNTSNISTLLQNGTSPWSSGRTYVAGNVVNHTNSLWIALASNTNSAPTDVNANWRKLATVDLIPTLNSLLPSQTGNANKVLTTNGTNASWANVPFATVNFDASVNSNLTGTFTRTGTTVTANVTAHGHQVGHRIYLFSSGVLGEWGTVATVPDANSFTYTSGTSGTIASTAFTLQRRTIRKATNVHSVAFGSAGVYFVNFTSAATDANYALTGSSQNRSGTDALALVQFHWNGGFVAPTVNGFHVIVRNSSTAYVQDMTDNSIAVFA